MPLSIFQFYSNMQSCKFSK